MCYVLIYKLLRSYENLYWAASRLYIRIGKFESSSWRGYFCCLYRKMENIIGLHICWIRTIRTLSVSMRLRDKRNSEMRQKVMNFNSKHPLPLWPKYFSKKHYSIDPYEDNKQASCEIIENILQKDIILNVACFCLAL